MNTEKKIISRQLELIILKTKSTNKTLIILKTKFKSMKVMKFSHIIVEVSLIDSHDVISEINHKPWYELTFTYQYLSQSIKIIQFRKTHFPINLIMEPCLRIVLSSATSGLRLIIDLFPFWTIDIGMCSCRNSKMPNSE